MKYLFLILLSGLFGSCEEGCKTDYHYEYDIHLFNIKQDSLKIIYNTNTESGKVLKIKIHQDTTILREFVGQYQGTLHYVTVDGIPKDIDANFRLHIYKIEIYHKDSLVYREDPANLNNWNKYYRPSSGFEGAIYTLKLDSLFRPILK